MDADSPTTAGQPADAEALRRHVAELEARLQESEETLDAIRRGEIDALVVSGNASEHRIYTLDSADQPYRALIEQIGEGALTLGLDGTVFYCNRRLAELLGASQERVIGQALRRFVRPAEHEALSRLLAAAQHHHVRGELTVCTPPHAPAEPVSADAARAEPETVVSLSLSPLGGPSEAGTGQMLLCGVLTDLTEQRRTLRELSQANQRLLAESAQRELAEEALRQSQKMEAVGQLTGGLAHDFNNLLTGIAGSLQLMRARIAQGRVGELERYVAAAQASADRAAALTHRLLAFSRRQTLDPKLVEANRLVAGMEELLARTVGATVSVHTELAAGLGSVLCDPNQLENALLNLAINARDAMPQGGRLTIRTADMDLDPAFAAQRDMAAGRYVTVSVTDTGTGMPPDVVRRAFDPFFTTKPIGMGTGLGLSMIYGFAKQSGGQVRIHSREGLGTTVRLYLPRLQGMAESSPDAAAAPDLPQALAGETVLVVDDEPVVRMLVVEVLQELGYAALEAADGASGLRQVQSAARIDLLVTDVGLPGGMNGRQLADAARVLRPGLRVLFITGFAESAAVGNGVMEHGMAVMTKPFAMEALALRIQAMIRE